MKIFAVILFAISVALLIIGLHQIMVNGFAESYWIIMFSTFCFFGYGYIKKNILSKEEILVETKDTLKPKQVTLKKSKR